MLELVPQPFIVFSARLQNLAACKSQHERLDLVRPSPQQSVTTMIPFHTCKRLLGHTSHPVYGFLHETAQP